MTHGSLFSGIGGFDLAAEWMGWENKFHCEFNPFGQKVLKYYWPNAQLYDDITKSTFTFWGGKIDILTGGFPCQPYSTAGKRLGKEDSRHLWPEMLRVIREVKPRWVVGENVRGLISWNGGLVFNEVQADLESEGYEVLPLLLAAAGVNAPHRRDRIWFIAHSKTDRCKETKNTHEWGEHKPYNRSQVWNTSNPNGAIRSTSHANHTGGSDGLGQVQGTDGEVSERNNDAESCDSSDWNAADSLRNRSGESRERRQTKQFDSNGFKGRNAADSGKIGFSTEMENRKLGRGQRFAISNKRNTWNSFPTVSPICDGDDGISKRLDSITFSKWRKESIKAAGNAVVPQVVYQIFKAIEAYERTKDLPF